MRGRAGWSARRAVRRLVQQSAGDRSMSPAMHAGRMRLLVATRLADSKALRVTELTRKRATRRAAGLAKLGRQIVGTTARTDDAAFNAQTGARHCPIASDAAPALGFATATSIRRQRGAMKARALAARALPHGELAHVARPAVLLPPFDPVDLQDEPPALIAEAPVLVVNAHGASRRVAPDDGRSDFSSSQAGEASASREQGRRLRVYVARAA